jgi:hypothetical protein
VLNPILLQTELTTSTGVKAKLVQTESDSIRFEPEFDDNARKAWHQRKMTSKLERAASQLKVLQLEGTVVHILSLASSQNPSSLHH